MLIQKPSVWAPSTELVWSGLRRSPGIVIEEWTPAAVRPLIAADQVWSALKPSIEPPVRSWTTGVSGLSRDQFAVLVRLGEPAKLSGGRAFHDSIDHLGVLFNASADGAVRDAILVPQAPVSFVDKDHYFTFRDHETGLVQVIIWRIEQTCSTRSSKTDHLPFSALGSVR